MKQFKRGKFGIAILGIVAFVIGTAFAFGGGRSFHRGSGPEGFPAPFMVEKIAKELGLNEEQKTKASEILNASKEIIKPLMDEMKQHREATKDLGTDGVFEEAKVNQLANEKSETMKKLMFEKEKTKAQLFAILTLEQREKAKQMQDQFGNKMRERFGKFMGKNVPSE